jgi:hypothetical protein
VEAGVPDALSIIKDKQVAFFMKLQTRDNYRSSYLYQFIQIAINLRTPMGLYISRLSNVPSYSATWLSEQKDRLSLPTDKTRYKTYLNMNPTLSTSEIYYNIQVEEFHRISMTRLRLASHRLKIETGRWARIPRENRLCSCTEGIQSEEHVLIFCKETEVLRDNYEHAKSVNNIADLFDKAPDMSNLAKYCHKVLSKF